jgi:hypothetical protein
VFVVVIAVGSVPVTVVGVIHVIPVRNRLVPAAGAMRVHVPGMGQVRQRVLIVMAIMRRVRMPFVYVVDVSFALCPGMAAVGSVDVVMPVNLMLLASHDSSLLW